MPKRKSQKKNSARRAPPLSALDKTVYFLLVLLCAAVVMGLGVGIIMIHRTIAYADETVIAVETRGTILWAIPFCFGVLCATTIPIAEAWSNKQPLFGKRGIRYGSPEWKEVYPLFMKNKSFQRPIRPSERRYRRFAARVTVAMLAVTFLLVPLSLFGRNSLHEDMSTTVRNVFDEEIRRYDGDDIHSVTYRIVMATKGSNRKIVVTIRMSDGRSYQYTPSLDVMLRIKAAVPLSIIRYRGTKYLEELIRYRKYDPDEAAKVRSLFD